MATHIGTVFVDQVKIVTLVGSVSRRAGGLFESVRRLDQETMSIGGEASGRMDTANVPSHKINVRVLGIRDECTDLDSASWFPVPVRAFRRLGPRAFGYAPGLADGLSKPESDLVHVHGVWQFASLAALKWHQGCGRPYVVSPHGMLDSWALRNGFWKKKLGWLAYEKRHLQKAACLRALCAAGG